jgi:hypothetical protein
VSPRCNAFDDVVVAHVSRGGPISGGRPRGACSIFDWFSAFVTGAVKSFSFAPFVIEGRFTARSSAAIELASKHAARASVATG